MKGDVGQSRAGRGVGEGSEQRKRGGENSRECGEQMEERGREILGGKMKKVKQSVKRRRTRRRC